MTGPISDPLGSGAATLRVDREAVPALRRVFDKALAKLDVQIDLAITGVRVAPWAGDPISQDAATSFNDHSVDTPSSALNALLAYQQRLKSASDALTEVDNAYHTVEGDNAASFRDKE
ncbi:MAG TPA: transcriptional regulator [Pseudonocardiaceae bacterium]